MSMNATPSGERTHIALFGRRNAGKSSLINAITGQNLAIVSDMKGTTSDPVKKAMELLPLGPVVIIDTPGLDDDGPVGKERIEKAKKVLDSADIALIVSDGSLTEDDFSLDTSVLQKAAEKKIPAILILNKQDQWIGQENAVLTRAASFIRQNISFATADLAEEEKQIYTPDVICVSARTGYHIHELKEMLGRALPTQSKEKRLVGDLLAPGDFVVLVVPIDDAAPKGRLILPQQQVIRDALESGAIPVVCRDTELNGALSRLGQAPRLVITDSQAFAAVSRATPQNIPLTSFSILFSRYKGDLKTQIEGVLALNTLRDGDKILMAEGCTHHRQCGDIGTVKIPGWIREYTGRTLHFHTSSGEDFPEDLSQFKMVVHCGGCTLNPREMARRIALAKEQNVPIVNYGTLIAQLKGVLERSVAPLGYRLSD